jgi:hypothetical protein
MRALQADPIRSYHNARDRGSVEKGLMTASVNCLARNLFQSGNAMSQTQMNDVPSFRSLQLSPFRRLTMPFSALTMAP